MKLNCKSMGSGPALIILHGLFGSLDNWITLARKFGEHYSVYLIDQRNHGRSPHTEDWSYRIMADDLLEFMDQQGIYKAHLLGHSMGGKVVLEFAGCYPDRVDKMIVADMTPREYPPHHTEILRVLADLDLDKLESRKEADVMLSHSISQVAIRQFLLKNLGRQGQSNRFQWKFNLPVILKNYDEILREIVPEEQFDGPALFVYGGLSPYLRLEDKPDIRHLFPDAHFVEIPNTGHWLHAEAPGEFLEIVLRFLD